MGERDGEREMGRLKERPRGVGERPRGDTERDGERALEPLVFSMEEGGGTFQ